MTTAAATNTASLVESYARGATDVPLIEQTIGAFFADMVARQPDREALVSVHQGRRYTYAQLQTPRAQDVGLFRRVLSGLSCRDYEAAAEAVSVIA